MSIIYFYTDVVFCRSYTVRSCVRDRTGGSHAPHSVEKNKRPTKKIITLYFDNARRDFDHEVRSTTLDLL